ncbi:MAG: hypothetical protein JW791_00290 [Nanoarchaeota archaeon]|nr:hypothetical protein [Nanoarchaeota archaeon]
MPIVGKAITDVRIKIDSKEGDKAGGIQNNMLIRDIEEKKMDKNTLLLISCNLVTTYLKAENKPLAQFMISEDLYFSGKDKELKEIVDEWKKNKKLPKDAEEGLVQSVNTICMYDLQFFTNRMGFPPPTGFSFNIDKAEKKKKK